MDMQEVRAKYPQYSDMSDGQLADALHKKFYSDIPKEKFYSSVGYKAEADTPTDLLGKFGKAGRAAFEGATALPLMAIDGANNGPLGLPYALLRKSLGMQPSPKASELVGKGIDYLTNDRKPETKDERLTHDVVSGLTGALSGGGPLKLAGSAIGAGAMGGATSGLTREAGGPQWLQILAGVAGGFAPKAVHMGASAVTDKLFDVGATVGAAFNNKSAIQRLAEDAATRTSGADKNFIAAAEKGATNFLGTGVPVTTAEAIAQRNRMTPDVRAGSTVKLQQELSGGQGATDVLPSVAKRQLNAMFGKAAPLAGGLTREEQNAAIQLALQKRADITGPMRDDALKAANTYGVYAPQLTGEANRFAEVAANKVQDVRRMAGAADRAENMGTEFGRRNPATGLGAPTGMPSAGKQYSYGQELAGRAENIAGQSAESSLLFGNASNFAKRRADSLATEGFNPLKSSGITGEIDNILATPGKRASDVVDSALSATKEKVNKFTNPETGIIDARDLATIRNEVGTTISKFAGENKNWDQRLAAGLETDIKKLIDAAINKATGTSQWTDYLGTYGGLSRDKDKLVVGQAIMDKLRNEKGDLTAAGLLSVLGRGENALLKTKSGSERNVGGLLGLYGDKQYGQLEDIANQVLRQESVKKIGGEVKGGSGSGLASGDIPQLPNLLSRTAMIANYGMRMFGKSANDPVANLIAHKMANGTYSELLSRPVGDPLRTATEAMIRASLGTVASQGEAQ